MDQSKVTARSPEDILAIIPSIMGFNPDESIVMLTFGPAQFHARVDLPLPHHREHVTGLLLEPCQRHGVERVLFVFYTEHDNDARDTNHVLTDAFNDAGIPVVDTMQVSRTSYRRLPDGGWVDFDTTINVCRAQLVAEGRAPLASREDLVASLAAGEVLDLAQIEEFRTITDGRAQIEDMDREWVRDTVVLHALGDLPLEDATLAALLADLTNFELRDAVLKEMSRTNSGDMVQFWTEVVRRTPEEYLTAPATLLALAAWLHGDGALAWVAVDKVPDQTYLLAQLVTRFLTEAVSPNEWQDMFTEEEE